MKLWARFSLLNRLLALASAVLLLAGAAVLIVSASMVGADVSAYLLVLLFAITLYSLGIWWLLRAGLNQLKALEAGANAIANGQLDVYLKPTGSPALHRLTASFNRMAQRVLAVQTNLQQSESHLRAIVETTPGCVKLVARDGTLLAMNPAGLAMIEAASPESVVGKNVYGLIAPEYRAAFQALNERVCAGETGMLEFELIGLGGSRRWLETRAVPFTSVAYGGTVHLAVTQDITERKQVEARLQLAASVFSHAREGIMITDPTGCIVDVNDTFTRITGYSAQEVRGQNPRLLNSGRQGVDHYATMWQDLRTQGHWTGEVWNRRKNGEIYAELQTVSAVFNAAGQAQNYVALFSDITSMKEHQQQLERIAHYDVLTKLPNRVLLADRLQQAMIQSLRHRHLVAVVFLDLDGFKAVNDHHGHGIGDELLIVVSQRMKAALREGDTLARIGGDEFVALLVDLDSPQDGTPVLERLLQAAAEPVLVGAAVLHVSASMGVTLYPQDDVDADALLLHADHAMYAAKLAGKNRYHVFDAAQPAGPFGSMR